MFWIGRRILSLRYDIDIEGLDALKKVKQEGGMLFCPNHPAEVDPIIMINFFSAYRPRPLVVEHFFHLPGAAPFMKLVGALDVPNFETAANKWKQKKADSAMIAIKEGLDNHENFLIYPAGHLRRSDQENVGGSSFVHKLVSERPETKVVLIRMEGLWGSSFSRALTGELPDFWRILARGIWIVIKNGIFFVPKRKVKITVEVEPEGLPKTAGRKEFNSFLDEWYNKYTYDDGVDTHEHPKLVPFTFYNSKNIAKIEQKAKKAAVSYDFKVSNEMRKVVYDKLHDLTGIPVESINDEMRLSADVGLDSLDIATMHAFLDQKYGVPEVSPSDLVVVKDLFALALGKIESQSKLRMPEEKRKHKSWPKDGNRPDPYFPDVNNMAVGFLETCRRMGSSTACCDMITGPLSYKKLKLLALIFTEILRKREDRFIGIMLPSSTVTYLLSFAIQLAGKVPVMLNWTTGQRSLDYAHNLLDLGTVITSRNFLDRVGDLELSERFENSLLFVEEIKKQVNLKAKLKGAWLSMQSTNALVKRYKLNYIDENDPAVLLFTSGTETYPKAVPLSHRNIMCNQRNAISAIHFEKTDCLFSVLPSFHSFGFSVTGTLPILLGVKAFYSPDPTDSLQMAKDIDQWDITLVCLAPTFLQNLFSMGDKKQFHNVRLFVSGAEKAPDELFEYVRGLDHDVQLIEGYGITECSPIVTMNPPDKPQEGVGAPIPGIALTVINPDTGKELAQGEVGEVCIHGDSVFSGYMSPSVRNPFVELQGKRWYRSGDLGKISDHGCLLLMGRIKRFIKVGGEMISLSSVEDTIRAASISKQWDPKQGAEPSVAVAVRNPESPKPEIVLFSTFSLTRDDANKILKDEGFGRIVKIAEVQQVPEIPLTGTGKVHFRKLDEMVT